MEPWGDYVVYVDESGDHQLATVDPNYPVFVLAFCIFKIDDYVDKVVPQSQRLKFEFFGHDMVVLHEREIRKSIPPFDILLREDVRERFIPALSALIADAPFTVVAVIIDKVQFAARRGTDLSPYHVALEYGLERVFMELQGRGQVARRIHVVFESRGKAEDHDLELEFRRIMDATRMSGMADTLGFCSVSKQANSTGLQIADMIARPIGLHHVRPGQRNRAWEAIEPKLRRSPRGDVDGWGIKIYP